MNKIVGFLLSPNAYTEDLIMGLKDSIEVPLETLLSKTKYANSIYLSCKGKEENECPFYLLFRPILNRQGWYSFEGGVFEHVSGCILSQNNLLYLKLKKELIDGKQTILHIMRDHYAKFRDFEKPTEILMKLKKYQQFKQLKTFYCMVAIKLKSFSDDGLLFKVEDQQIRQIILDLDDMDIKDIKRRIKKKFDNTLAQLKNRMHVEQGLEIPNQGFIKKKNKKSLNLTQKEKFTELTDTEQEIDNYHLLSDSNNLDYRKLTRNRMEEKHDKIKIEQPYYKSFYKVKDLPTPNFPSFCAYNQAVHKSVSRPKPLKRQKAIQKNIKLQYNQIQKLREQEAERLRISRQSRQKRAITRDKFIAPVTNYSTKIKLSRSPEIKIEQIQYPRNIPQTYQSNIPSKTKLQEQNSQTITNLDTKIQEPSLIKKILLPNRLQILQKHIGRHTLKALHAQIHHSEPNHDIEDQQFGQIPRAPNLSVDMFSDKVEVGTQHRSSNKTNPFESQCFDHYFNFENPSPPANFIDMN